ncbi:MAG: hypothetical protein QOJ79_1526 [Actinomycetota bacterium]|jgi:hypothetical protein|nr:hypothetical protein [Actinomycetota bacterium]
MRRTTLLAGFSAATLLTGMTFAHANPTGPKGEGLYNCPQAVTGSDSGFTVTWSPTSVFPPNHKYVDGTLTYTAAPGHETDSLTLTIDAMTHNEYTDGEEWVGSGNTLTDTQGVGNTDTGSGSVSVPFQIRAERSGTGSGRTYTIGYTAKADPVAPVGTGVSNDCSQDVATSTVEVFIPHDMGGGNDK